MDRPRVRQSSPSPSSPREPPGSRAARVPAATPAATPAPARPQLTQQGAGLVGARGPDPLGGSAAAQICVREIIAHLVLVIPLRVPIPVPQLAVPAAAPGRVVPSAPLRHGRPARRHPSTVPPLPTDSPALDLAIRESNAVVEVARHELFDPEAIAPKVQCRERIAHLARVVLEVAIIVSPPEPPPFPLSFGPAPPTPTPRLSPSP